MAEAPPTSPQRSRYPPPPNRVSTPARSRRHGEASTNTPLRASSALSTSAPTAKSNPSYVHTSRQSTPATPVPATQIQMDKFIESELHNSIFHDPKFVHRFLSGNATKLDKVYKECGVLDSHYRKTDQWKLPLVIKTEKSLYDPVLHILNTIKEAVDTVNSPTRTTSTRHPEPAIYNSSNPPTPDDDTSGDYVPDRPEFINTSTYTIPSDRAETRLTKPDLVLFEDVEKKHRHWEHVRMPVEIKKLTGYHKAGMKQLSRYARAVFAHQLHRRHLYAMMVCNTEATFVRFDRAGILYSHRINLRTDSKAFTYAFASLLMLDRTDQGYDPAFTCRMNQDGRLDYYVNLPASAFTTQLPDAESTSDEGNRTHRFLVVDRLCRRRSICGRATIVLRIRKVEEDGNEDEGDEYILKIMWRDPERGLEGEVLRKVKGKFGLAQHVWHGDAFGKCCCSPMVDGLWKCKKCVAETARIEEPEICDKLMDIAAEVPLEDEKCEKDPVLTAVDTSVCHPTSQRRPHRICVFIVISSKGLPLERAGSPRQFMQAVLDAILGYWGLFNIGILHRDISEGNVLMVSSGRKLDRRSHNADSVEITDKVLIESEKKLREILDQLEGREPTGMLSDFDLYAYHSLASQYAIPSNSATSISAYSAEANHAVTSPATPSVGSISDPLHVSSGTTRSRQEDVADDTRESKRHKISSRLTVIPVTDQILPSRPSTSGPEDKKKRIIDFRTGTPAFMSIRVLSVSPGTQYNHTFLDDLESFFWLILWSAAAHLDAGVDSPTESAQAMLNQLNQSNPRGMRSHKTTQLTHCHESSGYFMLEELAEYENSWALDPLFSNVIVNFGNIAYKYRFTKDNLSPIDVFPEVVGVFQNALSDHPE
ncbi:unnamed protein product [Rhizoctonia solani]|uniref:Fungal-type protein kinase domain-containing protein n=1 Tax=Rhizoctonia solani TaxID=456999 RepID=A0A8H3H8L1_9AGAM|nr:unnamed protein product [Rhizoctonia solani]